MDDRYRRELTKLRGGELPGDLWDRVQEGPRMTPLVPSGRSRVKTAVVALAVFALAAFLVWRAFERNPHDAKPAGSNVLSVPARGETSAPFLADGRPVFVVHHMDGTVSVVDAFSSHRAFGVEELNVWCPSTRQFVEVAHEAHFDEFGGWVAGPAPGGIATFGFQVATTDAAGDPSSIAVGALQDGHLRGGSGPERPPFCPPGGTGAGLRSVTTGYTGETGMVLGHDVGGVQVWDSPAEAVAASPSGWIGVAGTMLVARDGFVRLCAQVIDDACEGGVVVRGVDGVRLWLNVTRFHWVSGYEEPQVWLVQIHDGVIDHPAGFSGILEA